jgi:oligopeptide/dipeptide ABC transporter ATP-binding protein
MGAEQIPTENPKEGYALACPFFFRKESLEMTPLLQVNNLRVRFHSDFGDRIVTDDISFHVDQGETLGIVGESGCGKSVTNLAIMGLLSRNGTVEAGSAVMDGKDLLKLSDKELDKVRGKDIAMVFQDALASLDPVFPVGKQIEEQVRKHLGKTHQEAQQMILEDLRQVGIPDPQQTMKKYPSELSGGMRQRIMIAMALSCGPKLLIADEPTTALDVTIQAQIMQLIRGLAAKRHMSVILITHDIGVVAQNADRVMVMYAGQFVEEAPVRELFRNPLHPYTRALLAATPSLEDESGRELVPIPGTVPENYTFLTGCRFAGRCALKIDACDAHQEWREVLPGHYVRCCRVEAGLPKGADEIKEEAGAGTVCPGNTADVEGPAAAPALPEEKKEAAHV